MQRLILRQIIRRSQEVQLHYFFHYRDENDALSEDRVGSEHPNVESAEREARELAQDYLQEAISAGGSPGAPRSIEIVDERGRKVLYVPFWASPIVFAQRSSANPLKLPN